MINLKGSITLLFAMAYLSWAYSGLFLFKTFKGQDKVIKYAMSALISMFCAFSLFETHRTDTAPVILWLAIFIVLTGLLLFWWAVKENAAEQLEFAYTSTKDKKIIQSGPFAWVRHPFYLAYLMTWSAYALYVQSGMSVMICFSMYYLFVHAAMTEEQALAKKKEYRKYQAKVGMFLPKINFH